MTNLLSAELVVSWSFVSGSLSYTHFEFTLARLLARSRPPHIVHHQHHMVHSYTARSFFTHYFSVVRVPVLLFSFFTPFFHYCCGPFRARLVCAARPALVCCLHEYLFSFRIAVLSGCCIRIHSFRRFTLSFGRPLVGWNTITQSKRGERKKRPHCDKGTNKK